jgi:hypothetical protein
MAVTVNSSSADGKHYQIRITQTGADTGTVDLTTWQAGQDPQTSPGSQQTYSVDNITASQDGSKLVCQTHVFFFSPTITVTVHGSAPHRMPFVRVEINDANATDYPVSEADENKLKQFIVSCDFPAA